jgi:hypothetical protein
LRGSYKITRAEFRGQRAEEKDEGGRMKDEKIAPKAVFHPSSF